ncbi:hypothetical protein Pcinc_040667 [Petrolisthes cinctipes]|uniref:Uncharacterized protein n=1 Tax=Petrolisthes cinctipes TaxID=88211 RepID=A0AAE1BL12_PETCI|nr:hypothetical protein Pcinc_040667 [Petrolisthes cinctipes]
MRVRDGSRGSGSGQVTTKMSTLDYLVTKVKRHVRASSADSAAPPTPVIEKNETSVLDCLAQIRQGLVIVANCGVRESSLYTHISNGALHP